MPSLCVVAGDPSGDAHAARLITVLKSRTPTLTVTGLGGPALRAAGAELLDDLTTTAAIGPFDAARHLQRYRRATHLLEERFKTQPPDLVLLVDFGDYNLPVIAPLAKRYGLPVVYYISPQLWAWGRWRRRFVQRYVDRMIVFFSFEETFYQEAQVPVTWVGHPLIDEAKPRLTRQEAAQRFGLNPWRMTVGLLPGSRADEIRRHLPLLIDTAKRIAWHMPGIQFLIPTPARSAIERLLPRHALQLCVADGSIYDALQCMEAAVVTSGTATLEAALCEVPMIVVYRTSWPTYLAAKLVLRIPHIGLVNVVAEREVVPEFVQHRASPARIANALVALLRDQDRQQIMRADLRAVRTRLGEAGAVERAASAVLNHLAAGTHATT